MEQRMITKKVCIETVIPFQNDSFFGIYHLSNTLSFYQIIFICRINQAKCVIDGSTCGPTSNFLEVPGEVKTSSNAKNYFFDSIQHRRRNLNKHRYTALENTWTHK